MIFNYFGSHHEFNQFLTQDIIFGVHACNKWQLGQSSSDFQLLPPYFYLLNLEMYY